MEVLCLVGSGSGDAYALWGNESGNSNALLGIASGESLSEIFPRGPFVLSFVLFFFLISFIKIIFELFVSSRAASLLSLLPASLLVLLLHRTTFLPFLAPAIIAAAILRLLSGLLIRTDLPPRQNLLSQQDLPSRQDLQFRRNLLNSLTFLLDFTALFLYLSQNILTGQNITDKLLFISLTVLTLSALQQILVEHGRLAFPMHYFALLGVILLLLPMKTGSGRRSKLFPVFRLRRRHLHDGLQLPGRDRRRDYRIREDRTHPAYKRQALLHIHRYGKLH